MLTRGYAVSLNIELVSHEYNRLIHGQAPFAKHQRARSDGLLSASSTARNDGAPKVYRLAD